MVSLLRRARNGDFSRNSTFGFMTPNSVDAKHMDFPVGLRAVRLGCMILSEGLRCQRSGNINGIGVEMPGHAADRLHSAHYLDLQVACQECIVITPV